MLYLARHGRTSENAERRLLGRRDPPLDELGRRQAQALARVPFLAGASRVVSSPLRRAVDTAEAFGPPVSVDDRWIEIDYGIYDGVRLDEGPELWAQWSLDLAYAPEGGESLAAVSKRVRECCDELWEEAAHRDVVVVSHVSPIKAAVAWALGAGDETSWRMFLDVASVCAVGPGRVVSGKTVPALRSFNEIYHRPSS